MNERYEKVLVESIGKHIGAALPQFSLHEKGNDYLIYSSPRPLGRTCFIMFNYHRQKDWFSVDIALSGNKEFPWRAESSKPSSPLGSSGMLFHLMEEGKQWVKSWKITGYDRVKNPLNALEKDEHISVSEEERMQIDRLVDEAISRINTELVTTVDKIESR